MLVIKGSLIINGTNSHTENRDKLREPLRKAQTVNRVISHMTMYYE